MRSLVVLVCLAVLAVAGFGALGASSGQAQDGGPTGATGPVTTVTAVPTVTVAPTSTPPTSTPTPTPTRKPVPEPKRVRPRLTFSVVGGQTATTVIARGLRVRLRCSVLCGVRARLYRGSRGLGQGIAILRRRRGTVRVPVAARHAAGLTRRSSVRLQLRMQATSADALDSKLARRGVTLKRG